MTTLLAPPEQDAFLLEQAIARTRNHLLAAQHPDGYWCGELQGDTILESEYILLLAFLEREHTAPAQKAARYLLQQQEDHGGWSRYPGGPLDVSASVKAYFALKLTGCDPSTKVMTTARDAIRRLGGADRVNSFTRFYLALLGQISYDQCPAVPPEAVLLPGWFPCSIYRVSAWSRTILVPLSIMWAHRPTRRLSDECNIDELFIRSPDQWPELRCVGQDESPPWWSWDRFFRRLDAVLKWCEKPTISRWLRPLRRRALRAAESWMIERFADSDGLGAIFPPIIWSAVALKCLGYETDHPLVQECLDQLERLCIEETRDHQSTIRLQPCKSPVWDTALSLRALAAAQNRVGLEDRRPTRRAVDWLLSKEVRQQGDWAKTVGAEPAGWFFEHHNAFYPDVDDTIMVMMALREQYSGGAGSAWLSVTRPAHQPQAHQEMSQLVDRLEQVAAACNRARQWVLAMQNRDGGWGAFDKDNDAEFLCRVPFADHNAMIDPSTPDLTARVLEALAQWGARVGDVPINQAIRYLRRTQEPDGSWFGRWGVNYIYGTWQVLVGLKAVGVSPEDPAVQKGLGWLLSTQQTSGGWGESCASYDDPTLKGKGAVTASQTAWALLGLMTGDSKKLADPVRRGVEFLLGAQRADGGWEETEFTGTGFPRVFYLRYHMYPLYFPLLALCRFASWRQESR